MDEEGGFAIVQPYDCPNVENAVEQNLQLQLCLTKMSESGSVNQENKTITAQKQNLPTPEPSRNLNVTP